MTIQETALPSVDERECDELIPGLRRLDSLLSRAIAAAEVVYGADAGADPYRGLYISSEEVERLLAREPGAPAFHLRDSGADETGAWPTGLPPRLARLQRAFDLTPFDLDLILIALAPELDLRYERLYAYLQDDVSRRRPSMDLALSLLCATAGDRLARRAHFAPNAPLIRHGVLQLSADPSVAPPPVLARSLQLDEQIVRWLLDEQGLDPRLDSFCALSTPAAEPDPLPLGVQEQRRLRALVTRARQEQLPLRLNFHGLRGIGKRQTAAALAAFAGMPLLESDLPPPAVAGGDPAQLLRVLFREAWLQDALLLITGLDALAADDQLTTRRHLEAAVARAPGIVILTGERPWAGVESDAEELIPIHFALPDFAARRECWSTHLAAASLPVGTEDLDALAGRFRLTPGQIRAAVRAAHVEHRWRAAEAAPPTSAALFAAARAQTGQGLAALARKIEPRYAWEEIVLPPEPLAQLQDLINAVRSRHVVFERWGFDRRLSLGRGLNALFAGPSGTGKTMAAEVIAHELALDLYKIDLSQVVSKYIGETEKNLDRVFREAQSSNAILFFDEADALFGKRSEVKDAHDRYANIETGYLLQKMEEYEGVAILATNLPANMDEAFARRMQFTVEFPFPDEEHRHQIWRRIFPTEAELADDVDPAALARSLKLSGGNIRNVALAAAFLAAHDGQPIAMGHLMRAARREFHKVGRSWEETRSR